MQIYSHIALLVSCDIALFVLSKCILGWIRIPNGMYSKLNGSTKNHEWQISKVSLFIINAYSFKC